MCGALEQLDGRGRASWIIAALLALLGGASMACAAEVDIDLSTRRPIAGVVFQLEITISNAEQYSQPVLPEVDWAERVGGPSRRSQSQLTSINGRMRQRRMTILSYDYLALEPGRYTFPPVALTVDGSTFRSPAIPVSVTKAEGGELVHAEITAERNTLYLGEPLKLTLRIWIKRFVDRELGEVLDDRQVSGFLNLDRSSWGPFAEALSETVGRRGRALNGREVMRTGEDGQQQVYYLYELTATQWPKQTGTIEIDPVRLLVEYPTELGRNELFNRLYIVDQQSVVTKADAPTVEVLAPPAQGRPDVFAGAVGRFSLTVSASPKRVAVGDPITLTLIVTDETDGRARLEMLQPPPLLKVDALSDEFRVPSEPLTGVVQGRSKVFRQTIRARRDGVDSIPSIPFAYFDPEQQQYVTLRSDPISIDVDPATTVAASDVEGVEPERGTPATELTELEGGILANKTGTQTLLANQRFAPRWWHGAVLMLPALVFIAVAATTVRRRRLVSDAGLIRARKARRRALQRIGQARRLEGVAQAETVAAALSGYVEDRVQAPQGAMTRADVVDRLRGSAVSETVVDDVEQVLQACEALKYGAGGSSANGIVERAGRCSEQLERSRLQS